jgi:hypothetical protein
MIAEALIETSVELRFVPPRFQSRGDHRITRRPRQRLLVDSNRRVNVALAIEDVAEQTRGLGHRWIDLERGFERLASIVEMAEQEFGKSDAEHRLEAARSTIVPGETRPLPPAAVRRGSPSIGSFSRDSSLS